MSFKKAVLVNIPEGSLDDKYWQELDTLVDTRVSLDRDDPRLIEELIDCDVLLLGFQVPIAEDIFDAAPNLKLVNILATAFGTVDLEIARQRNIPVCNLAGYSTESVAEFVIATLFNEIRGLHEGLKRAETGNYDESGIHVREIKNSNFGVIGLGSIGSCVAELAAGLGANVSYWSQHQKEVPFAYKELDDLLATCSYISVNVAESEGTLNLLNADNLKLLQPGAVLISTVPPSVINTSALVEPLTKGDITFVSDHPDSLSPQELEQLKNTRHAVFYPPIAYISDEARIAKQEIFIANLRAALDGKPQNQVN